MNTFWYSETELKKYLELIEERRKNDSLWMDVEGVRYFVIVEHHDDHRAIKIVNEYEVNVSDGEAHTVIALGVGKSVD